MSLPTLVFPFPVNFTQGASGQQLSLADGAVTDNKVAAGAGISTGKLQHRFRKQHAQPETTATTETKKIYTAIATGSVVDVSGYAETVASGAATVTIDLQKSTAGGSWTSVLTSPITLNSSSTAKVSTAGAISSAAYVAGDQFRLVFTATAAGGTIPTGAFGQATFDEAAA